VTLSPAAFWPRPLPSWPIRHLIWTRVGWSSRPRRSDLQLFRSRMRFDLRRHRDGESGCLEFESPRARGPFQRGGSALATVWRYRARRRPRRQRCRVHAGGTPTTDRRSSLFALVNGDSFGAVILWSGLRPRLWSRASVWTTPRSTVRSAIEPQANASDTLSPDTRPQRDAVALSGSCCFGLPAGGSPL
jgi:hypothetical protein